MKIKLLFPWLIALLFTITAAAQVQVGTGTRETTNLPFEPYFGFSYAQTIYLQSAINASGTISSIQYFYSGTTALPNSQDLTIHMGEVAGTKLLATTDWEPLTNLIRFIMEA